LRRLLPQVVAVAAEVRLLRLEEGRVRYLKKEENHLPQKNPLVQHPRNPLPPNPLAANPLAGRRRRRSNF
jgi:hypothetical protein